EDYITSLAEDNAGTIWLGFRQKGLASLDSSTNRIASQFTKERRQLSDDYVFTILPDGARSIFVATYGGGLVHGKADTLAKPAVSQFPARFAPARPAPARFPSPARPPTFADLNGMLREVSAIEPKSSDVWVQDYFF